MSKPNRAEAERLRHYARQLRWVAGAEGVRADMMNQADRLDPPCSHLGEQSIEVIRGRLVRRLKPRRSFGLAG